MHPAERVVRDARRVRTNGGGDPWVVLVNGAWQRGKSTLVAQIGRDRGGVWRSLDRAVTRQSAEYDPTEFVAGDGPMVIDEVQRVPQLLLAIKETVDADPRPGRFLLTGAAPGNGVA